MALVSKAIKVEQGRSTYLNGNKIDNYYIVEMTNYVGHNIGDTLTKDVIRGLIDVGITVKIVGEKN